MCHKIDQQSRWWELDPLPPLTRDAEIEHQCRAAVGLAWVQAALHIFLGPELAGVHEAGDSRVSKVSFPQNISRLGVSC